MNTGKDTSLDFASLPAYSNAVDDKVAALRSEADTFHVRAFSEMQCDNEEQSGRYYKRACDLEKEARQLILLMSNSQSPEVAELRRQARVKRESAYWMREEFGANPISDQLDQQAEDREREAKRLEIVEGAQ